MANDKKKKQIIQISPQNLEVEEALLACLLLNKDAVANCINQLTEDDFYSETNRAIFKVMNELYAKGIQLDYITVSDAILKSEYQDKIDLNYIASLTTAVPSSANYNAYFSLAKDYGLRRKLISAGTEISAIGYNIEDGQTGLNESEKLVYDIAKNRDIGSLVQIGNPLNEVVERIEIMQRDPDSLKGILTGITELDEITNGLQKSDLIILAARPGIGKTSLAMNAAVNAALNNEKKVAIFNLEMPKTQLALRSLCSISGISMEKVRVGKVSKDEWTVLLDYKRRLSAAKIFVDDNSMNTPMSILSKCRRLQREHGLDMVVIDYIQLMQADGGRKDNRQQEVSDISRKLKVMARELNVPVLALSQLNRAVATESKRGVGREPQLSDLRESGAIEQDADIVMFIHKQDDSGEEANVDGEIYSLIVAKHRNGRQGKVPIRWNGELVTFTDVNKKTKNEKQKTKKEGEKEARGDELTDKDAPPELESYDNFTDGIF